MLLAVLNPLWLETLVLPMTLQGRYYHQSSFSNGETEAQRLSELLVLEYLIHDRGKLQTQAICHQTLGLYSVLPSKKRKSRSF